MNHAWWSRSVSIVVGAALLLAACGGSDSLSSDDAAAPAVDESSSVNDPNAPPVDEGSAATDEAAVAVDDPEPDESADLDLFDQITLDRLVSDNVIVDQGTYMAALLDRNGQVTVSTLGSDSAGVAPGSNDLFRIGSISKILTSLATLTLVDEGLVDLDAPAVRYVTRVPVPADVTVRNLLKHRSGIASYTDQRPYLEAVFDDKSKVWTPEETLAQIEGSEAMFEPGSQYRYSNSNYTILAVLVEEVTGQPFHQAVRERVLEPSGMGSTYLTVFEEGPAPFEAYLGPDVDPDFDYTSIGSSAWASGGYISSAEDLHAMFVALFDGEIISPRTFEEMIDDSNYGLGLELADWPQSLVGHGGLIPGYISFVRHSSETGITAFTVATDELLDTTSANSAIVDALGFERADVAASLAEPPPNDRLANAVVIDASELPFTTTVDTTGATRDEDDEAIGCPAPAIGATVWYTITPTDDVTLSVSLEGSDYLVGLSAAEGTPTAAGLIECRPNGFTIDAVANETYYLHFFDGVIADGPGVGGELVITVEGF